MSGLYEILAKIKINPGQYLEPASVSNLFAFLVGCQTARRELAIELTPEEQDFYREFQPWLQKTMNVKTVNSWANIIQLFCINETEAFNYFFQLLEQFSHRERKLEPPTVKEFTWKNSRTYPKNRETDFYSLLEKIKEKPGLYLGKTSLETLFTFIQGWEYVRDELGIEPSEKEVEFRREFQPWIQDKFKVNISKSWAKILTLFCRDEKEAFDYFFNLLDEFFKRSQKINNGELDRADFFASTRKEIEPQTELLKILENLSDEERRQVEQFAKSLQQKQQPEKTPA